MGGDEARASRKAEGRKEKAEVCFLPFLFSEFFLEN
jgi:hypothetical protein